MSLGTWVEGALRPSPLITWYQDGTETPEDLTGATITGTIRNRHSGVVRPIAGTFTVTDGAAGEFRWDLDAADVAEAGQFSVQFAASFASGASPAISFATEWAIVQAQEADE